MAKKGFTIQIPYIGELPNQAIAGLLISPAPEITAVFNEFGFDWADVEPLGPLSITQIVNAAQDLPLDSVLVVDSDLDMKNWRKKDGEEIPDFNNVYIVGNFNAPRGLIYPPSGVCREYNISNFGKDYFNEDIILPPVIGRLNCAYSISSLDVLIGAIDVACEVIVQDDLIKPSALEKSPEKVEAAKRFIDFYPRTRVLDKSYRYEIRNVLKQIEEKQRNIVQKEVVVAPLPKAQKTLSQKIDGQHIEYKDVVLLCRKDAAFGDFNLSDDELDRIVRLVISKATDVKKETFVREDGAQVKCIPVADWQIIRQRILDFLAQQKNSSQEAEQIIIEADATEQKTQVAAPVIKPIKIEKYISDALLKQIRKSSGAGRQESILRAIDEINLDPRNDFGYQGAAKIIKDNVITASKTIKKESGCSLVQSPDSSRNNDRKRLVWTVGDGPNGPVIVCTGFFEHHIGTTRRSNNYFECLQNAQKTRSFSQQELDSYINISKLLNAQNTNTEFMQNMSKFLARTK